MLFISLAVFLSAIPMKETYKPVILKHRASKDEKTFETPTGGTAVKKSVVQNFFRPMHMLGTEACHLTILRCRILIVLARGVLPLTIHGIHLRHPLPLLRRHPLRLPTPAVLLHRLPYRARLPGNRPRRMSSRFDQHPHRQQSVPSAAQRSDRQRPAARSAGTPTVQRDGRQFGHSNRPVLVCVDGGQRLALGGTGCRRYSVCVGEFMPVCVYGRWI